jgi:hypothetical protein
MTTTKLPRSRRQANPNVWTSDLVPGVEFEVLTLTKELAEEFLTHLPERQRAQSERTIDKYAADLLSDQFPFTGDPIRFNADGELIDGQHRCTAVVESGVPVVALIIRGLGSDMIRFFDGGRTRRFPDDLRINGFANHTALAAVTGRVWHWEHGNYGYMGVPYVQNALYADTAPTRAQLWKTLQAHPELPDVVNHGQRLHTYVPNAPTSVTALMWWLLGQVDVDAREKFFHELTQGSGVNGPEYPINVLHRTLTRRIPQNEEREGHIWLAYYIKAYNAWASGATMSHLRMPVPLRWNRLPMPQGMVRPGLIQADEDEE